MVAHPKVHVGNGFVEFSFQCIGLSTYQQGFVSGEDTFYDMGITCLVHLIGNLELLNLLGIIDTVVGTIEHVGHPKGVGTRTESPRHVGPERLVAHDGTRLTVAAVGCGVDGTSGNGEAVQEHEVCGF